MRFLSVLGAAALALATTANAAPDLRRQARLECRQQARAMHYVPNTVKWKNSIKECMIDMGFKGR